MLACDKKTASRTPTSPDIHRSMLGPQAYSHFGGQAFIPSQMRIGWSRNSIFMMAYYHESGTLQSEKCAQPAQCNQSKCDTSNSAISAIEQPTTDCKKLKTIMQELASSKYMWPV
jgi:hypothetical protein